MSNKTWIISTIIAGIIFYSLSAKVNKKYTEILNKDTAIVSYYTDMLK
jgi:hypothetical protein